MIINAKYDGICPSCDQAIYAGERIVWNKGTKAVHLACDRPATPPPTSAVKAPTREDANKGFKLLEKALRVTQLEIEDGAKYTATAGEFEYMHMAVGQYAFKHGDTRNYLFVNAADGKLFVPKTDKPFMRGYFGALAL